MAQRPRVRDLLVHARHAERCWVAPQPICPRQSSRSGDVSRAFALSRRVTHRRSGPSQWRVRSQRAGSACGDAWGDSKQRRCETSPRDRLHDAEQAVAHMRPVVHNETSRRCGFDTSRSTLARVDMIEEFPVSGYVRQARRRAKLNQRELAERAETSQSTIARAETGSGALTVPVLLRVLRAGGMHLAVVDGRGRWVPPLQEPPETRDLAGRRFPAHLDLILDPHSGDWWGDRYGLLRPPETFHRDPRARLAHRQQAHAWRGIGTHGIWKTGWRDTAGPRNGDGPPGERYEPPWQQGGAAAGTKGD
ncbi:MAG: helix-turn-helix domain-containing protein [Pseudonocardiaceae bacterium]|nr:helix-turn-helix domain-containing protein [Pseudonocardiaceae bacterium]